MKKIVLAISGVVSIVLFSMPASTSTAAESQVATPEKQTQEKREIRWNFERGTNIDYVYKEETTVSVGSESNIERFNMPSKEFTVAVDGNLKFSPNGDGTANLKIKMKETSGDGAENGNSTDFMSGPPTEGDEVAEVEVIYKPDGKFEVVEEDRKDFAPWVKSILDKLYIMPDIPSPEPGYSWETSVEYLAGEDDAEVEGGIVTTFVGWEDIGGKQLARFEYKMSVIIKGENENVKATMKISGDGFWYFDPQRGRIFKSNSTYSVNMHSTLHYEVEGEDGETASIEIDIKAGGDGKVSLELED